MKCQTLWMVVLIVLIAGLLAEDSITTTITESGASRLENCKGGSCISKALDHLSGAYQILPGINISSGYIPVNSSTVSEEIKAYLKSLTLHVALYHDHGLPLFGTQKDSVFGRAANKRYRYLSIYIVLAIAFVILSALIGKAMSLSIVALFVALITRVNIFGVNSPANSPPVFDIVRRPQVQIAHTQSAEEVFEAPSTAIGGGVSYVYPLHKGRASALGPYAAYVQDNSYAESQVREPPMTTTTRKHEEQGYQMERKANL